MNFKKLIILFSVYSLGVFGQTIKTYKLENGLTVILDSNPKDAQVFGQLVVNVGSADEDENATGVAHYLEHMLFKGTTELGTIDWEKEKEYYDEIIKLYDELQEATTQEEVDDINKKINDTTQKESQYIVTNELSAAVQQMGGVGLNASTSYDRTEYHNVFPTNQLEKWLKLYSHRFDSPVFRLFQTELETVYEEKNRSADNTFLPYIYKQREIIYGKEDPYARPIIGKTSHLKKPWMQGMINFYEKWYVPNNMALILVGDFDVSKAENMINKYFGALKPKVLPPRSYTDVAVPTKRVKKKIKLTPYLVSSKTYIIPKSINYREDVAFSVLSNLLSDRSGMGLLDELVIDGDVISANASFSSEKRVNIFEISYAPRYDINQRRQESFSYAGKMIDEIFDNVRTGRYDDKLLENIKIRMMQSFESAMVNPSTRSSIYADLFVRGIKLTYINKYDRLLKSINKDYLNNVCSKYFSENYILVESGKGRAGKEDKIKKPKLDPVKSVTSDNSKYLKEFMKMKGDTVKFKYFDVSDVEVSDFSDKIKLHYLKNERNNIFKLVINFKAGTSKYKLLKYSIRLMNNAGIMGQYTSSELKREFGKLNVSYSFSATENDTYIVLGGYEDKLGEACQLLSRLMLMPEIKEKSLDGIIGRDLNNRYFEKKSISVGQDALREYLFYGDNSSYIDRISSDDLILLDPTKLSQMFNDVVSYQADIHYYGKMPLSQINTLLKNNLAFGTGRKKGLHPSEKEKVLYKENTILLVNEPKATQSHIYLYVNSEKTTLEDLVKIEAFNQYFSGSFNGLVTKEIRENRALAYTSSAMISTPLKREWNSSMLGYVGTQADKTAEVVEVLVDLLSNMPKYPERIKGIKDYLINSSELENSDKSMYSINMEVWKEVGYKANPILEKMPLYETITFEDIEDEFVKFVKDKKIAIAIIGKIKDMDVDRLEKVGDVKKISKRKMFSRD